MQSAQFDFDAYVRDMPIRLDEIPLTPVRADAAANPAPVSFSAVQVPAAQVPAPVHTPVVQVHTPIPEWSGPLRDANTNEIIWETDPNWVPLSWNESEVPIPNDIRKLLLPIYNTTLRCSGRTKRFNCGICTKQYARRPDANIHVLEAHLRFFRSIIVWYRGRIWERQSSVVQLKRHETLFYVGSH